MRLSATIIWAVVLAVLGTAPSGCHRSGQWADDPGNYKRAWGSAAPPQVTVVHSFYWRSPHFTREEVYYFEFAANKEIQVGFVTSNALTPFDPSSPAEAPNTYCLTRPRWFAPKGASAYEGWRSGPGGRALLLRDRETGALFVYACQL